MSEVTLYLSDAVFVLSYLPAGSFSREEYDLKSDAEKLQLHENALVNSIKERLMNDFKIEAKVSVSQVKSANGAQAVLQDFNIPTNKADDVAAAVEDAIFFHNGSRLGYNEIEITMHGTLSK